MTRRTKSSSASASSWAVRIFSIGSRAFAVEHAVVVEDEPGQGAEEFAALGGRAGAEVAAQDVGVVEAEVGRLAGALERDHEELAEVTADGVGLEVARRGQEGAPAPAPALVHEVGEQQAGGVEGDEVGGGLGERVGLD